jgi:hypothetical protein
VRFVKQFQNRYFRASAIAIIMVRNHHSRLARTNWPAHLGAEMVLNCSFVDNGLRFRTLRDSLYLGVLPCNEWPVSARVWCGKCLARCALLCPWVPCAHYFRTCITHCASYANHLSFDSQQPRSSLFVTEFLRCAVFCSFLHGHYSSGGNELLPSR